MWKYSVPRTIFKLVSRKYSYLNSADVRVLYETDPFPQDNHVVTKYFPFVSLNIQQTEKRFRLYLQLVLIYHTLHIAVYGINRFTDKKQVANCSHVTKLSQNHVKWRGY